jgi:2-polyprenyl-3-methyl-5-hydroxy-6-metoxy-1,4-benzoquinol methylase
MSSRPELVDDDEAATGGGAPAADDLYARAVRGLPAGASTDTSPCPVCAGTSAAPRFEVEGVAARVVVCDGCGLGRFHPMPGAEEIRELYPDEYYGEPGVKFQPLIERMVRIVGERHITFLSRGLPQGGRVLDVGCGRGVILGALADRGFEVHGVEISAEAARGADARAEIRIAPRLVDADYPDAFFDEVVIWHVLEHLQDPQNTIREAQRVLRPQGRLIVAVPNFSSAQARWSGAAWFHLDLPRHLYQFSLAALRRLLEDAGFEVRSDHHFSLRQNPFGWIQSVLNLLPFLPRNGLYTLLQRRADGGGPPYGAFTRMQLWLGLLLLSPLALVATGLETLARTGATVHVVAVRRPGPSRQPRPDDAGVGAEQGATREASSPA